MMVHCTLLCSLIPSISFPVRNRSHVEKKLSALSDSKCALVPTLQLMNEEDVFQGAWLMGKECISGSFSCE